MDALREAFAAGTSQEPFSFSDYQAIRRLFRDRGIPVGPTIDLDAPEPEDLEEGRKG